MKRPAYSSNHPLWLFLLPIVSISNSHTKSGTYQASNIKAAVTFPQNIIQSPLVGHMLGPSNDVFMAESLEDIDLTEPKDLPDTMEKYSRADISRQISEVLSPFEPPQSGSGTWSPLTIRRPHNPASFRKFTPLNSAKEFKDSGSDADANESQTRSLEYDIPIWKSIPPKTQPGKCYKSTYSLSEAICFHAFSDSFEDMLPFTVSLRVTLRDDGKRTRWRGKLPDYVHEMEVEFDREGFMAAEENGWVNEWFGRDQVQKEYITDAKRENKIDRLLSVMWRGLSCGGEKQQRLQEISERWGERSVKEAGVCGLKRAELRKFQEGNSSRS